jgi:fibronectin-binding autotransporter adhesin
MVTCVGSRSIRGRGVVFGATTAIGVCFMAPAIALADCQPYPTQANVTTTCTGSDAPALTVNTSQTTVVVQSGASVPSIDATTSSVAGQFYPPTNYITITDNGQIAGGLTVDSGTPLSGSFFGPSTTVNLTVGATGSITGTTAISLITETGSSYPGAATLALDNQGSISSASGPAIISNSDSAQVANLINEAGASIGAIQAPIVTLNNAGTIAGGSGSAIDTTTPGSGYYAPQGWQNSGMITSGRAAATINAPTGASSRYFNLQNSGQIINTGTGSAISLGGAIAITNVPGGTISAVGGTAITSNSALSITNSGTISGGTGAVFTSYSLNLASTSVINGWVEADNLNSYFGSTVNLSGGGGINGSLTLGAPLNYSFAGFPGNTLIVDYTGGANPLSSISGTVSVGGAASSLVLAVAGGTTLAAPLAAPATFTNLGLQLASGGTVALGGGFNTSTPLALSVGAGGAPATLINQASITVGGALFTGSGVIFDNSGTINASPTGAVGTPSFAISISVGNAGSAFTNSGTITSQGAGVHVYGNVTNSGSITASGDTLSEFDGTLNNSGTITATNGTAVVLFGNQGIPATNSGTISGGQTGVEIGGITLTNSGTISAPAGSPYPFGPPNLAVALDAYGTFSNAAGGVVNGNIGFTPFTNFVLSTTLTNAGTINGNVNLGAYQIYGSNTFVAVDGGVLNGNLFLGNGGDRLVTDLTNTGPGAIPGITGTVSGGGFETLVYRVTADTTATLAPVSGMFSAIGYDLANNPSLTLATTTPLTGSYSFAGTGTVNLTADIAGNGSANLLNLTAPSMQTNASGMYNATVLNFTSNGNLSVAASGTGTPPPAAVLVGNSTFTNNGTISFNDAVTPTGYYYGGPVAAISGGTVINTGTVLTGGAAAIASAASVVNTGSILQLSGAADGTGIVNSASVTNSGTIATGGDAVDLGPNYGLLLSNSGTISSRDGSAIAFYPQPYFGQSIATITNLVGGVISGGTGQAAISLGQSTRITNAGRINGDAGQPAIALCGFSTVTNSGTINGDVALGTNAYGGSYNIFNAQSGGVVNGNLNLGSGGDRLVTYLTNTGAGTYGGVTGTVSGSGVETLVYRTTADGTATLAPASGVFTAIGYDLANGATLTLSSATPQTGSYSFAGTGTVDLTADISGNGSASLLDLTAISVQTDASGATIPTALSFTSKGNLTVSASGSGAIPVPAVVLGSASSFTNNGTISFDNEVNGSQPSGVAAIAGGGTVTNNGTILIGGASAIGSTQVTTPLIVNTGSILQLAGASDGTAIETAGNVTNSGTIATGGSAVYFTYSGTELLTNSGTISSTDAVAVTSNLSNIFTIAATINNQAGGSITGGTGQAAIAVGAGSVITNAGTINGDVQLGLQANNYYGSTYVASGGTLNGNLTFSGSGNTLLVLGNSTGITGAITGGTNNIFAQAYTASRSIDISALPLAADFVNIGIGAVGAATVLNVTGPAAGFNGQLTFFGNGTINNSTNVNSAGLYRGNKVILGSALDGLSGESAGLTFVNSGNLADGVGGTVASFTNSGTVGTTGPYSTGANLSVASGVPFAFSNSGQIVGGVTIGQFYFPGFSTNFVPTTNILNSGSVAGGLYGYLQSDQVTFINSGTIEGSGYDSLSLTTLSFQPGQTASSANAFVNVTNTAGGILDGPVLIGAATPNLLVNNEGQINSSLTLTRNSYYQYGFSPTDQATATLVNSGTIAGSATLYVGAASAAVTNSGQIGSATTSDSGLMFSNVTQTSNAVSLINSGSIVGAGAQIMAEAGNTGAPAVAAITVSNSGSIANSSGGLYFPAYISPYPYFPGNLAQQQVAAGLSAIAQAPGGSTSVQIVNAAGASILGQGTNSSGSFNAPIPAALANGGSVGLFATADTVTLLNSGTVVGGPDTVLPNDGTIASIASYAAPATITTIAGGIEIIGTTASVTNTTTGTITGNTILDVQNAAFTNYGTINGNVTLGSGSGSFVEGIGATLNGTANAGTGTASLTINVNGGGLLSQARLSQFTGFADPHLTGSGAITTNGSLLVQTLVLDNAALTLAAGQLLQTGGPIALSGGAGANSFTNYGTVNGAIVDIDTTNGVGGVINISATAATAASFTNAAASAQLNIAAGTFTLGQILANSGGITVAGGAALIDAAGIANYASGVITVERGGSISDTLVNSGMVINHGTYNADIINQAGASFITTGAVNAPDSIVNAGTFTGNGAVVTTPVFTNAAGGIVNGSFSFGPGGTLLTNQGTIAGNIVFGSGANELLLQSGSQITGNVTGGSGANLLSITSNATDAAPDQFALGGVTGFQQSQLASGAVALSGPFTTGSFVVLGGHLIGNSGSVLTAATVSVASGAVFSSAGTVNGNIAVSGTLAPVGTMTVNGNVALGSGSTALFAGAGSRSSELVTSGSVAISPGSTLTVSGPAALRQGSMLDLIQAAGGISGSFSVVNEPAGAAIILHGDQLELYNPFIAAAGFSGGATGALTAINALAASGQASRALLAALPALSSATGVANPAAFARLTPEAYATATQIGTDDSLQVADTLRSFDDDDQPGIATRRSGAFTFIEGLGNWTHMDAGAALGSSSAHDASGGVLGGSGWRGANAAISAFGGGLHNQQSIAALGVTTSANTTIVGANAYVGLANFTLEATIAYAGGNAYTQRPLPDGNTASGRYRLHSLVADVAIGYNLALGTEWRLRPQIGYTHVSTRRTSANEDSSPAFDLAVNPEHRRSDFVDASIRLGRQTTATAKLAPWVSLGVRTRLSADDPLASAYLPGSTDALFAFGAARAKTVLNVKAGFSYAISPVASLYANYSGSTGSGGSGNTVNGGVRVNF